MDAPTRTNPSLLEPDAAACATVITANRRLARELRRDYDLEQVRAGRATWRGADILPLGAWLEGSWREWLYSSRSAAPVRLLRPFQERVVWEEIVAAEGSELMQVAATAEVALEAWNLLCRWHVPLEATEWGDSDDAQAFRRWARRFLARCSEQGWLSSGVLPAFVADRLDDGSLVCPERVILAGFSELTPAEERLVHSLRLGGCSVRERPPPVAADTRHAVRLGLLDRSAEIRTAAEWCLGLLERASPSAMTRPIGVVVPELGTCRAEVERVFAETLHPGTALEPARDAGRAFNISLAPSLNDYPLVRTALAVLGLDPSSMPLEDAGRLLRSPFVGSWAERSRRGLLDRQVRRLREPEITADILLDCALQPGAPFACPELAGSLVRWRHEWRELPEEQRPSRWAGSFSRLLDAIGWPGNRPLSSAEFQTLQAWTESLSELAGLDPVSGLLSLDAALSRLHRVASARLFQPETERAPIQILGLLEASGLEFGHVWIMGMHDGAWPRSAGPNPFLPLRLQRRLNLPGSSPRRELEFAERLTGQLCASAPSVLVSYPEREGDEELRPSPLLSSLRRVEAGDILHARLADRLEQLRESGAIETVDDSKAPPWAGAPARGGTAIFQLQAACPFRAFATVRLGARPLESARPGLDARDRGNLLHQILERIWAKLGSQTALRSMSALESRALVSETVRTTLEAMSARRSALSKRRFLAIERARLERLLCAWLELERTRQPFTVMHREQKRRVEVGGVGLDIRIDRVDRLEDGTLVVIDYKTGEHRASEWDGSRPDEPQLPLYAVTAGARLGGVFFGVLKAGATGFEGLAASENVVPGLKPGATGIALEEAVASWRGVVEHLGRAFREGSAAVNPKEPPKTCRTCPLPALCRVQESAAPSVDFADPDGDPDA